MTKTKGARGPQGAARVVGGCAGCDTCDSEADRAAKQAAGQVKSPARRRKSAKQGGKSTSFNKCEDRDNSRPIAPDPNKQGVAATFSAGGSASAVRPSDVQAGAQCAPAEGCAVCEELATRPGGRRGMTTDAPDELWENAAAWPAWIEDGNGRVVVTCDEHPPPWVSKGYAGAVVPPLNASHAEQAELVAAATALRVRFLLALFWAWANRLNPETSIGRVAAMVWASLVVLTEWESPLSVTFNDDLRGDAWDVEKRRLEWLFAGGQGDWDDPGMAVVPGVVATDQRATGAMVNGWTTALYNACRGKEDEQGARILRALECTLFGLHREAETWCDLGRDGGGPDAVRVELAQLEHGESATQVRERLGLKKDGGR